MYAVIKTGGKQYRVAPDDVLSVEKITGETGDIVQFNEVLLVASDKDVSLGAPLVSGASVAAEVVEQGRARKIIVFKKKRRKGYRRTQGHRQHLTKVKITEILTGGKKPSAAKAAATPKAEPKPKAETAPAKTAPAKTAPAKAPAKTAKAAGTALFTAPKGAVDDLKKISGVGPVLEKKLNSLGITQYAQIAKLTKAEIERVDEVLSFKGRIEREDWRGQAKALAKGAKS